MDKSKLSFSGTGKYLREVSVVVIGVAITLSASYWITNRNEKRDIALYLNAIKMEMEMNIKSLDEEAKYQKEWNNYRDYLLSHDKKSIDPDSIRQWDSPGLGAIRNIIFQTSAFEMFKSSGAMRLMNDKELLQSMWQAYLDMESCRLAIDLYYTAKLEEAKKENQLENESKSIRFPIPLYDFFKAYFIGDDCEKTSKELKEIVKRLEKN